MDTFKNKKPVDFLNEFKNRTLRAFPHRIRSIALFGSRATGRAESDSDYDVFVMVDTRDRNLVDCIFDIAYDIYMESNLTFDISPVIMSEEFFNARLSQERRIAREIKEQGIPYVPYPARLAVHQGTGAEKSRRGEPLFQHPFCPTGIVSPGIWQIF